jgi:hypothetical protein
MTWPQPTRQAHEKFCQVERWSPVRDARGRSGTHHITYELSLKDGRIVRTRASHPPDRTTYGPSIWSHILRDQLDVTEAEFWSCVQDASKPDRGDVRIPAEAIPADVVYLLITRVGLAESDVVGLTKDDAVSRLNRFWAEGT